MNIFSKQFLMSKANKILNTVTGNPVTTLKGVSLKQADIYGNNQDGQFCGDFVEENKYKINLKIEGINLIDYTKAEARNDSQTVEIIDDGVKFTGNYYFYIPVKGLKVGMPYTFYAEGDYVSTWNTLYVDGTYPQYNTTIGNIIVPTKEVDYIRVYKKDPTIVGTDMIFKNMMLIEGKNLFDVDNATLEARNATDVSYENGIWYGTGNEGSSWSSYAAGQLSLNFSAIETANKTVTISLYMTLLEQGKWTEAYLQYFTGTKSNYSRYNKVYWGDGASALGQRILYTWTFETADNLETFVIRLINNRWAIELSTLRICVSEEHDYQPYQEPQSFDLYLPKQIVVDEFISVSFNTGKASLVSGNETTDISNLQNWSKIPKLKDTNIIAASAEIPPSNMDIYYYSKEV